MGKTNNAKARMMKSLMPLCTKLSSNIKSLIMRRKNKVGPIISANNKKTEVLLLSDGLIFDRRDDEYLQARRAILNSYHLSDGHSLKQKMKRTLKELCRDIGRTRVGVRVYRFTMSCPWNRDVLVFRCFLPHFKCIH